MPKRFSHRADIEEFLVYLRLSGKLAQELDDFWKRRETVEAARKEGIKAPAKELQAAANVFRAARGLNKAEDTAKWLERLGVSAGAFEQFIETNVLVERFKDKLERETPKKQYVEAECVRTMIRSMLLEDWQARTAPL